jgi:hypothetical protein
LTISWRLLKQSPDRGQLDIAAEKKLLVQIDGWILEMTKRYYIRSSNVVWSNIIWSKMQKWHLV